MRNSTKLKMTIDKCFRAACVAVPVAGLCLGISMMRPTVSRAFTLIERTAFVFPEITAQANENVMVCTNNLTGDGSVRAIIGVLDVADSTRFLPGTSPLVTSLDPRKGGCVLLLPAVHTAGTLTPPPARTGIPVIFLAGPETSNGGGAAMGKGLVSSAQLVEADGSVRVATAPTMVENVALPALP